MPPGDGDDGLVAAIELRRQLPSTGVLILSQALGERYALELIRDSAEGVGDLSKYRVGDAETFVDSVQRVAAGAARWTPSS